MTYTVEQFAKLLNINVEYVKKRVADAKKASLFIQQPESTRYNKIVVNGWTVTYRHRDDDRIKVTMIENELTHNHPSFWHLVEKMLDDCSGQEFAMVITRLYTESEAN